MAVQPSTAMVEGPHKYSITLYSYNLHGLLGQGHILLDELCTPPRHEAIIMLQELWLPPAGMSKIFNYSSLHTVYGQSAMEERAESEILRGRPWGGVATMIPNSLLPKVSFVKTSERFNFIVINNCIYVNVYLPCVARGSDTLLEDVLGEVEHLLGEHEGLPIIFGGDINTDLKKVSPHSKIIHAFMQAYDLVMCNQVIPPNLTYTYFNEALDQRSMTDYFFISNSLRGGLAKNLMIDNFLNLSDHLPIHIELDFPPGVGVHPPSPPPLPLPPLGEAERSSLAPAGGGGGGRLGRGGG